MKTAGPLKLPVRLLVLDFLGTILIALGLYELFSAEGSLFPEALRFPWYEWALILIGLAIMLPAVYGMVTHLARKRTGQ